MFVCSAQSIVAHDIPVDSFVPYLGIEIANDEGDIIFGELLRAFSIWS